jgi:hypothetical protein
MTKAEFDQYGTQRCYKNGRRHREDGPAVIYTDGAQFWYKEGELHREDGPAVDLPEGYKEWCIEGKTHRVDGPAIMDHDGTKKWFLNDKQLTKQEWWDRISDDDKIIALFNGEGA